MPARAQAAQQAALSDSLKSDPARPDVPKPVAQTTGTRRCGCHRQDRRGGTEEPDVQGDRQGESRSRNRPAIFSAACRACRRRAAPSRWGRCRMSRPSSPLASRSLSSRSDRPRPRATARRRRNSLIPTGWRHSCTGNIRRRHHRAQSRRRRRGRAGNDEAAADRGDRCQAGPGDLAGRHQCGAAQSRSRRDRQDGRGRPSRASRPPAPISCWSIRNIRRR